MRKAYVDIPLFVQGRKVRGHAALAVGLTISREELRELEERYGGKQRLRRCQRHPRENVRRDAFGRLTDKCQECRLERAKERLSKMPPLEVAV